MLGKDGIPRMRLPAVVVHHSGEGVGIMFDAVTNEQRRLLRGWLFDKQLSQPETSPKRAVA